jgi:hypothetical protein
MQLSEPVGGRRERLDTEHAAIGVHGGSDMMST